MPGLHPKQYKKGQPRHPDAGRKKGTPNKRDSVLLELVKRFDYDPFEFLVRCYTDNLFNRQNVRYEPSLELRAMCAKEACQYLYAKKRSIEVSGSLTVGETPAEGAFLIGAGQTVEALTAEQETAN